MPDTETLPIIRIINKVQLDKHLKTTYLKSKVLFARMTPMKKLCVIFIVLCLSGLCFATAIIGGQAGYSIKTCPYNSSDKRKIHGPDFRLHAVVPFEDSLLELDAGAHLLIGMYGKDVNFSGKLQKKQMNADLYALAGVRIPIGEISAIRLSLGPFCGFSNWKIETTETGKRGFMCGMRGQLGFAFNLGKVLALNIQVGYDGCFYDGAYGWRFMFSNTRHTGSFDAGIGVLVKIG